MMSGPADVEVLRPALLVPVTKAITVAARLLQLSPMQLLNILHYDQKLKRLSMKTLIFSKHRIASCSGLQPRLCPRSHRHPLRYHHCKALRLDKLLSKLNHLKTVAVVDNVHVTTVLYTIRFQKLSCQHPLRTALKIACNV